MGDTRPSALAPVLRYVNLTLRAWVMRKFKRFAAEGRFVRVTFSNEWPGTRGLVFVQLADGHDPARVCLMGAE